MCKVFLHLVFQGQEVKSLGLEVSVPNGEMSITFPDSSDTNVFFTYVATSMTFPFPVVLSPLTPAKLDTIQKNVFSLIRLHIFIKLKIRLKSCSHRTHQVLGLCIIMVSMSGLLFLSCSLTVKQLRSLPNITERS